jgi:uncharacterized protein YjiS (DUF1127 family)
MSTTTNAAIRRSNAANGLAIMARATVNGWWTAYLAWRGERTAITQLKSMSDRELRDIGLARSQIAAAVRGNIHRERDRWMITSF